MEMEQHSKDKTILFVFCLQKISKLLPFQLNIVYG